MGFVYKVVAPDARGHAKSLEAVGAEPEAALFDRSRFLPAGEAKGFQLIEAKALEDGVVCSEISQTKQPAVEHDSFEQ